jgi:uncharacterized Rmd1/YagE family protein
MKVKLFLIAIILYTQHSCVRTLPDEKLTLHRIPYNGKEIRIDGYYIGDWGPQNKYYSYIFFYSNGIMLKLGFTEIVESNQIDDLVKNASKNSWKVFQVLNNTINVQGWIPTDDTFVNQYILENSYFRITNDTTLIYINSFEYELKCHFKKFSPKPDSTNVFIK